MLSSSARNRKYLGLHHESVDSKIKFTIEPLPGDDAFDQWKNAMKAVAGLSMGIPVDYRKKVWLALADNYLNGLCIDWEKTKTLAFNRKSNPDDNKLDQQIVKDLHRTGCSSYSGDDNDEERAVLQRVLLAYARWNKQVGYCQGFNVIAALILDVMDRQEDSALKVMIYLIDRVLPESYFANNLRALSVDMAVFRHLLRLQLPRFSRHLDHLQASSVDQKIGASYEPPLTDVFTMQWFLTLFATCLPKSTTLRIWDAVVLEGSEVLLRTAVSIWDKLQERLLVVQTPDEFYTTMGSLNQEMLDGTLIDEDALIKTVYEMTSSSSITVGLSELRQAYTKRLAVVTAARTKWLSGGGRASDGDVSGLGLGPGDLGIDANCFAGMLPHPQQSSPQRSGQFSRSSSSVSLSDSMQCSNGLTFPPLDDLEKIAVDVGFLSKQYARLQERQRQARLILAGTRQNRPGSDLIKPALPPDSTGPVDTPIGFSNAVNHLYIGREMALNSRNHTPASNSRPRRKRTGSTHLNASPTSTDKSVSEVSSTSRLQSVVMSSSDHVTNRVLSSQEDIAGVISSITMLDSQTDASSTANACAENVTRDQNTGEFGTGADLASNTTEESSGCLAVTHRKSPLDRHGVSDSSKIQVVLRSAANDEQTSGIVHAGLRPSATGGRSTDNDISIRKTTWCANSSDNLAANLSCSSSSSSQLRAFNPFPKQYTSKSTRRRQLNGVRLGMYAAPSSMDAERPNR